MSSTYRRIFFWIFAILFLATTPLAVLYSQGYRFDQYKKIFIHSGSITIKATPSNVNVYIDGKLCPAGTLDIINNSITVNGLRPGNYNVRIAADGYSSWEKNIDVHSGVSTEFWNVLLAPKNPSLIGVSAVGAEKYFPAASGKKIAFFKKNSENFELWSLNVKKEESILVFSQNDLEYSRDEHDNIEWEVDENLMLVPVIRGGKNDFIVVDSEKSQESFFLSQFVEQSDARRARWSPSSRNEIYFIANSKDSEQSGIYRTDLDEKTTELIVSDVRSYDLSSSKIYFLRENDVIFKADLDGKNEQQLTFSPINFSADQKSIRMIAYDEKRQAIVSETGEFFIHNKGETGEFLEKVSDGVKGVQFSNDGKKILFWKENEIAVLFLRTWDVQPRREENELQQIIRFSSELKNVFWYRDYEHIFFSTQGLVKMIELDSRDRRNLLDILKYDSENFLSSYDSSNGIYYFVDNLKDVRKLFYVHIPEQTNFFGGQ